MDEHLLISFLLATSIFFATLTMFFVIMNYRTKKNLIETIKINKETVSNQIKKNAQTLQAALVSVIPDEYEQQTANLVNKEREYYEQFTHLFVHYPSSALAVLHLLINGISTEYIRCIQHVSGLATDALAAASDRSDDDNSQFEVLIEQLRFEKNDLMNRIKALEQVLNGIYKSYKEASGFEEVESLEKKSTQELASIFKVSLMSNLK